MKIKFTLFYFLLANTICFSQNGKPSGVMNMEDKLKAMFQPELFTNSAKTFSVTRTNLPSPSLDLQKTSQPILSAVFYRLTGSYNIFGNLYSNSKPLNYNPILSAYSFISRKSLSYNPASDGNEGTIVGYIAKNNAPANNLSSWDSTCLWTNTLNIAREVQGGIWNPFPIAQNTNVAISYLASSGSTKSGTTITGSFRASKLIGTVGTNSPGIDTQFLSNTSPFSSAASPNMNKHDLPSFSFNSSDDGVRTIGPIYNDVNASSDATKGLRGALISKGTFNSGVFVWTCDSFIPSTVIKTDGSKQLWYQPYMTFDPSGQVGYVVLIGSRMGSTGSNIGWQPIIYKTTTGGSIWYLVNSIDFNSTTSATNYLLNSLDGINTNTNVRVPFFDPSEGIDLTMDYNNKLHIVSTVKGTAKSHVDSLTFVQQYTIGTETYSWPHLNTKRPYILDFVGDGAQPWQCKIIDSVPTECPSNIPSLPGYSFNPWVDISQSVNVSSGMRIQASRSVSSDYILYSWAESDTTITTNAVKWNEFPNIKIRAFRVCDGELSNDEYNITGSSIAAVKDKAYFHYLSPYLKAGPSTISSTNSATIMVGVSVSNNNLSDVTLPVHHYFSSAHVMFSFPYLPFICMPMQVNEYQNGINSFYLYPNPTFKEITIDLSSSENKTYTYNITDLAGKQIKKGELSGNKNNLLNISELKQGVYVFNVLDEGRIIGVKKFVKE